VWRATGRRRGQYTWLVVAACMILPAVPMACWLPFMSNVRSGLSLLIGLAWPLAYLVLAVGSAIARLRYGK